MATIRARARPIGMPKRLAPAAREWFAAAARKSLRVGDETSILAAKTAMQT